MSKQIAPAVPPLPPLSSVQDAATRRALQALADGWNVRNARTGDGKERFLTEADVLSMARVIVISGFGMGGPGGGGGGSGGGGGAGGLDDLARRLIEFLGLPIDLAPALAHAQKAIDYLRAENNLSIARIKAMEDGFLDERTERIAQGSALLEQVRGMKVSVGNNAAAILEESTVRATQYDAMAQQITTLSAETDDNFAAVQVTINAQSSELAAQANTITALAAEVDDNTAAILTEQTARANADSALSSRITTVTATANNKSTVFVQSTAPTATRVNDLWIDTANGNKLKRWNGTAWVAADDVRITQSLALINQETTARVDADSALASDISTVSTALDGNIATVQQHTESINGIHAQWTIKTDVNGHVAGIGLVNDGVSSAFVVRANQFAVVTTGGNPQVPFWIGASNSLKLNGDLTGSVNGIAASNVNNWTSIFGTGKPANNATVGAVIGTNLTKATGGVAVSGDFLATWNKLSSANIAAFMETAAIGTAYIGDAVIVSAKIADAAITNAKIGTAAVDTLKIAGNAVTVPVSASGSASATTTATSFGGGKVAIVASCRGNAYDGAAQDVYITIKRGSTTLRSVSVGLSNNNDLVSGATVVLDEPGTGSVSYTVESNSRSLPGIGVDLVAIGVKR